MNWNAQPRDVIEKAAAEGDPEAQSALRLHQSLDRIDAKMIDVREAMWRYSADVHRGLNEITETLKKDPPVRRTRPWWRFW